MTTGPEVLPLFRFLIRTRPSQLFSSTSILPMSSNTSEEVLEFLEVNRSTRQIARNYILHVVLAGCTITLYTSVVGPTGEEHVDYEELNPVIKHVARDHRVLPQDCIIFETVHRHVRYPYHPQRYTPSRITVRLANEPYILDPAMHVEREHCSARFLES